MIDFESQREAGRSFHILNALTKYNVQLFWNTQEVQSCRYVRDMHIFSESLVVFLKVRKTSLHLYFESSTTISGFIQCFLFQLLQTSV